MKVDDTIVYSWEYNGGDAGDRNECDVALTGIADHKESIDVTISHRNNMVDVFIYTINSNS